MKKKLCSNALNNFMRRAHWLTLELNDEDGHLSDSLIRHIRSFVSLICQRPGVPSLLLHKKLDITYCECY